MPLCCHVLNGSITGPTAPLAVCLPDGAGQHTGQWLSLLSNCLHTHQHQSSGCVDCCSSRQHTDMLQGRACARDYSQQAISTQIPSFWGSGEGKEETMICKAEPCCAAWPRGREWALVVLLTRHFLCVLILRLLKSNSKTSLFCKNKCLFNVLQE